MVLLMMIQQETIVLPMIVRPMMRMKPHPYHLEGTHEIGRRAGRPIMFINMRPKGSIM